MLMTLPDNGFFGSVDSCPAAAAHRSNGKKTPVHRDLWWAMVLISMAYTIAS
jgi:hypothetical protein